MGDFLSTINIVTVTTPLAVIGLLITFVGVLSKESRGASLVLGAACVGILAFNYISFRDGVETAVSHYEDEEAERRKRYEEAKQKEEEEREYRRELERQERERYLAHSEDDENLRQRRQDEWNVKRLENEMYQSSRDYTPPDREDRKFEDAFRRHEEKHIEQFFDE